MLSALPDYLDISDPARNLAGAPSYNEGPYPTPGRQLYRAYDGTPIGYSKGCDPISAEPMLSGLDAVYLPAEFLPDFVTENRITWGDWYAMPLIAGALAYSTGRTPLQTALWSLAAYMAPLPVAGLLAYQATAPGRYGRPAVAGLGQARGKYKRGPKNRIKF